MDAILNRVKLSLRLSANAYDDELMDLIDASMLDMGIAGVEVIDINDSLIIRAITTYVKLNFGAPGDYGDYDKLKASYDEQKAQLKTSSIYNGRM